MEAYEHYNRGSPLNNRYVKISDISEGSYGLVSLAKDIKNNNALVAVKYIFPMDYKNEKQFSKHLSSTGRAVSSPAKLRSNVNSSSTNKKTTISAQCEESSKEIAIHKILGVHPNIPRLIDHFDSCLVLEYCSNGDLYEAMQNDLGPATSSDIKDVFAQILSAISFCHSKSVFHRDLKPENILISHDWSIKICDWGLATTQKLVSNPSEFDIGSERYMAPELFDVELKSYDASKVDLWSLGIILLTLVFHKNPFQVANYTDKRFLQFSANREALFDFFSTMTAAMFNSLRFCLTLDPSNRDLESFQRELQNVDYFTIDEEYYALHSEEEIEAEGEDNGYDGEGDDEEEADVEEQQREPCLNLTDGNVESEHIPNGTNAGFAGCPELQISHEKPDVLGGTTELTKNQMRLKVDENVDTDTTSAAATAASAVDDDVMPYNRRADALLSPTTHTKPIPINAGHQIRNTRKPFGVASYNKSNTFSRIQQGSHNNHSGSHGSKFRREDFFTPKSTFTNYMATYGESKEYKEVPRHYDRRRKWNWGRNKQTWKKRSSFANPSQTGTGSHAVENSKRKHASRKRKQQKPLPYGGSSHSNSGVHSHLSSSPAQFPMLQAGTTGTNNYAGKSTGKYIPPFLRSPQHNGKSSAVDAVSEEIDHLTLTDGEVFVLEDDYHDNNAKNNPKGVLKSQKDNTSDSSFLEQYHNGFTTQVHVGPAEHGSSAKYIPPFRRDSMGVLSDKRRSIQSSGSPYSNGHGIFSDGETTQSVSGENWLFKKGWRE